jgi:hypothetical protein
VLVGETKIQIFTVFGLTYHIVLKNDTLFVPSGQSPRSEFHSFKLIRGSVAKLTYVYKLLAMMNFRECLKVNFEQRL